MTVQELMDALQSLNPEAEVFIEMLPDAIFRYEAIELAQPVGNGHNVLLRPTPGARE